MLCIFPPLGVEKCKAFFFFKERMQQDANLNGFTVQLAVQEPSYGRRGYMAYRDWTVAQEQISVWKKKIAI